MKVRIDNPESGAFEFCVVLVGEKQERVIAWCKDQLAAEVIRDAIAARLLLTCLDEGTET